MDISADLEELAMTPVLVVCAGAKSILDLGLTLEYLETKGVPVIGYQTEELPAFYTRTSGFKVDYRLDTPEELAAAFHVKGEAGLAGGMLVTNPHSRAVFHGSQRDQRRHRPRGGRSPLPGHPRQGDDPLPAGEDQGHHRRRQPAANIQLVYNNAALAARTAAALSALD